MNFFRSFICTSYVGVVSTLLIVFPTVIGVSVVPNLPAISFMSGQIYNSFVQYCGKDFNSSVFIERNVLICLFFSKKSVTLHLNKLITFLSTDRRKNRNR